MKGKKIRKIVIVLSGLVLGLYLVVKLATCLLLIMDRDTDYYVTHEYYLNEGYIRELFGATTPHDYILVNEQNISALFEKAGSGLGIGNIADLENEIQKNGMDKENVKVKVGNWRKEFFEKVYIEEKLEDIELTYRILKRKDGEYYISIYGTQYTDDTYKDVECYIYIQRNVNLSYMKLSDIVA